jgi:hypothetical protein
MSLYSCYDHHFHVNHKSSDTSTFQEMRAELRDI